MTCECILADQVSESKEQETFKAEAFSTLEQLAKTLEQWETQQLLGGQYDKLGAILSIQVRQHINPLHHMETFHTHVNNLLSHQALLSVSQRQAAGRWLMWCTRVVSCSSQCCIV